MGITASALYMIQKPAKHTTLNCTHLGFWNLDIHKHIALYLAHMKVLITIAFMQKNACQNL